LIARRIKMVKNLILGAGITGISASYHLGHDNCCLLEIADKPLGILRSKQVNGFTWDQGPHVSFTKHEYVRKLFAENTREEYEELEVKPVNYFKGIWVDHPVQSNLYQLPEDLNNECVISFLKVRNNQEYDGKNLANYFDWSEYSLGLKITSEFIRRYTKKYWTVEPQELTTDWIGPRVHVPNVEKLLEGSRAKPEKNPHYINRIRYPRTGGYQSFVAPMAKGANVCQNHQVVRVDLASKRVFCANGRVFDYQNLISTLPLPVFVELCDQMSSEANVAAKELRCTKLLLVNVEVPHKVKRSEQWLYVYDSDMLSTRVTLMDNLSPKNAPADQSGLQVEVYFTEARPLKYSSNMIARKVIDELKAMGLIEDKYRSSEIKFHIETVEYANIIFDHNRKRALETIYTELQDYGLLRYPGDLDALTDWTKVETIRRGSLSLLGRYGEWKYYWSDDCIMAGKAISQSYPID
jgi:protoporphyrinogen oxidase